MRAVDCPADVAHCQRHTCIPHHSMSLVSFTRSLTASAAQVEQLAPRDFVQLLRDHWGSTRVQVYEWIAGNPLVRVYFDVDGKTADTTADALLARCQEGLSAFFHDQPGFDVEADVILATSHGGPKLSIRAYAPAYAMHVADIKARIRALRLGNKDGGVFDEAVYSARQKIRAIGAIKTPTDARQLIVDDPEDLHMYTIQDVPEDAVRIEPTAKRPPAPTTARATKKPRGAAPAPADPTAGAPAVDDSDEEILLPSSGGTLPDETVLLPLLAASGFADVAVRARATPFLKFDADRARPCACCQHTHDHQLWFATLLAGGQYYVRSYSARCTGMRLTPPVSPEAQAEVERQLATLATVESNFGVMCQTTRNMLINHKHIIDASLRGGAKMDLATVYTVDEADDAFGFRSCGGREYVAQNIIQTLYSVTPTRANAVPVLTGFHEAEILRSIMTNPRGADRCYATWFINSQACRGVDWRNEPRGTGNQLYRHSGVLWEKMQDAEFEALFATLAVPKMELLHAAITACNEPFNDEAAKKGPLKQLREAIKHLQTAKASRAMLQYARLLITAPNFQDELDRDRHLLGTPNGVLDLRTGDLLPSTDRARVSMTVRPKWRGLDTPTPDVDAFFRMIFDDDAAMVDYMQALLGAAVTGERLEVYVCFVGAGANGKGVTVGWLRHVLGPYYHEADALHLLRRQEPSQRAHAGAGGARSQAPRSRGRVQPQGRAQPGHRQARDRHRCHRLPLPLPGPQADAGHPHADPAHQQPAQVRRRRSGARAPHRGDPLQPPLRQGRRLR